MLIFLSAISIIIGFLGLIWSADKFVLGASTTANNLGVSALTIGLTIVAFGTSAPEIFTSAAASIKGSPEIAIGNVLGSNIANIGLVLGITAIICPIVLPVSLLKQELPALIIVTLASLFVFQDLYLNWVDGFILLAILAFFGIKLHHTRLKEPVLEVEAGEEYISEMSTAKALTYMLFGLCLMIFSSNILVSGAKNIALALGVSELVIGLTIVAIGTSLPELATSLTSVLKNHHDLAIGNIIGSNILNLLLVLPVPAFLSPFAIDPVVLWRDYTLMFFISFLLCLAIFILIRRAKRIGRLTGSILLLVYLSYTAILFVYR